MRAPQPTFASLAAARRAAAAAPVTRAALRVVGGGDGLVDHLVRRSMPRLTPDRTTGLPENRCCSRTSTSVAKITASALVDDALR